MCNEKVFMALLGGMGLGEMSVLYLPRYNWGYDS